MASSRDDGGISWFYSFCIPSVGFHTSYDWEFREPLLWSQGSPVSIRVVRGNAALISSHGRGIGPQDALNKES